MKSLGRFSWALALALAVSACGADERPPPFPGNGVAGATPGVNTIGGGSSQNGGGTTPTGDGGTTPTGDGGVARGDAGEDFTDVGSFDDAGAVQRPDANSPTGPVDSGVPTGPVDSGVPTGPVDSGVPTGPADSGVPVNPGDIG